jgi:hypothetical protein
MKIEAVTDKRHGGVMCRLVKEASFDEWLDYLFDRPEPECGDHWCFGEDEPVSDVPKCLTAEYIARTYEDPAHWMARFSKGQIAAGLAYTWNSSFSDLGLSICDEPVPWPLRRRAIRALIPLRAECFQELCESSLSHMSEALDNPVNGVCNMYWDVCPFFGQPEKSENGELDLECLSVMEATLAIDHDACRESALHGLGHWAGSYHFRTTSIIDHWLKAKGDTLRMELRNYAEMAKSGSVQ